MAGADATNALQIVEQARLSHGITMVVQDMYREGLLPSQELRRVLHNQQVS